MNLPPEAASVLRQLANGDYLKSHRYLDGTKVFQLHGLDGSTTEVSHTVVDLLLKEGLVSSNQKFPAATYMLTPAGSTLARSLSG